MIEKISYSSISTYMQCPRKWKLRYIDNIQDKEQSINLMFGTAMHQAIQEFLKDYYGNANKVLFQNKAKTLEKYVDISLASLANQLNESNIEVPMFELENNTHYSIQILEEFINKVQKYFPKRNVELFGIELELFQDDDWLKGIKFKGYLDIILKDTKENKYKIIDLKTAMRGWTDNQKKDESRRLQLILYKYFFSKRFDVSLDDIEVEFLILKKTIYEGCAYPISRIQKYEPPNSKQTVKKSIQKTKEIVKEMIEIDEKKLPGEINVNSNCKYCPFYLRDDLCHRKRKQ